MATPIVGRWENCGGYLRLVATVYRSGQYVVSDPEHRVEDQPLAVELDEGMVFCGVVYATDPCVRTCHSWPEQAPKVV